MKGRFDIVHCHFGTNALKFLFLKDVMNIKLVTTFHGFDISSVVHQNGGSYKELFDKGDLFLPVSDYFRQRLIKLGCPEKKTKVIYSGILVNRFNFARRDFDFHKKINILSVGRLTRKKGFKYVLLAIAKIIKDINNLNYTIVGEGKERTELEKIIEEENLSDHVNLMGAMNHEGIVKELNDANLFILTSITSGDGDQEGIPNVLKEAMAVGIPVISTYHAGIPEMIQDGGSGFLVHERDVEGLAQKLKYIIRYPEICKGVAKNGRKVVEEHFDIKELTQQLVNEYEHLVSC